MDYDKTKRIEAESMIDAFKEDFKKKFEINVIVISELTDNIAETLPLNELLSCGDKLLQSFTNDKKACLKDRTVLHPYPMIRNIYAVTAYKMGYSKKLIAECMDRDHQQVWYSIKKDKILREANDKQYLIFLEKYNTLLNDGIKQPLFKTKELKPQS